MVRNVNQVLGQLLDASTPFTSTEVAQAAGVSRQAVHKHLQRLVSAGVLKAEGQARGRRYRKASAPLAPLRSRLEVASAGTLYRLSARLLLCDLEAGEVVLDFTGVVDLGEEFLEEIFLIWAPAHPRATLRVEHLPAKFAPMLLNLARRDLAPASTELNRAVVERRLAVARERLGH